MSARRILVTGASGFLGARAAEMLASNGHRLALLLRNPEQAWRIQNLLPQVDIIAGDMMRQESYADAVRVFKPDTLLHAGWTGVSGATRDDVAQTQNIVASAELMKTAIGAGIEHFIGIGSQAEYGPQNKKLNEDAPTTPTTLYGSSKLAACMITRTMCQQAGIGFSWIRLFSAYGPKDNSDWLIPSMIRKIHQGEKPALTACKQLWDFIHIDDAADAVVKVTESDNAEGIYNLGGGGAPPLRDTITMLRDLTNAKAELGFGEVAYRPDQVMHLEADITRLRQKTNWEPRIALKDGLKQTVDYFCRS